MNRTRRRLKPILSGGIGIVMLGALLAGCSGGGAPAGNGQANGSAQNDSASGKGGSTTVDYPKSFSYWAPLDGNVAATEKSLNGVGAYQEIQKITGTQVNFQNPTATGDELQEKFNLLLASRNLPDVMEFNWLHSPHGPQNAIDSGIILKLNDLIDKYAPNFKKYLSEHPDVEKAIKTDKGDLYAFPFIRGDQSLMVFWGPIMRKDWLDKLHLQPPTTIDEWTKVLTAFKNDDPNGNGKKDEIPFEFDLNQALSGTMNELIGAWGIGGQFYQVDGKVHFGEIEPAFKDFITQMHDWYQQGLIDPDFASTNGQLLDAKVTGDKLGALYGYTGSGIGKYDGLMQGKSKTFALTALQNPTLKKGDTPALGQMSSVYPGEGSAAISAKAKNPEQIVKWLDFAYGDQGHMLFNFGVEGKSYKMVNGQPQYTEQLTKNPDGLPMTQAMGQYIRASYNGPFVQDKRYIQQYLQLPEQKEAIKTWSNAKNDMMMPPITMTADENKEFSNIMNDLNTYSKEELTKFIMGEAPLSDYDKFVSTIKGFNVDQAIAIQQAALDRYNKR